MQREYQSRCLIIRTNIDPEMMTKPCDTDIEVAMYWRFTDTCGAYEISTANKARHQLIEYLVKAVARNMQQIHNIDIDVPHVIRSIPGVSVLNPLARICQKTGSCFF